MEEKTYDLSIPMKDGTTQKLRMTRTEVECWLIDHRKEKLICHDANDLLARFMHAYQLLYNKEHKNPKSGITGRGGARPNAGRKAKGGEGGTRSFTFRVSEEIWDILKQQVNKTAYIENAIRFYRKRGEL